LNPSKILPQYSKFWQIWFQNIDKNENIGEHSICNFSTNLFGGREMAQEGGEILQKVSPKL